LSPSSVTILVVVILVILAVLVFVLYKARFRARLKKSQEMLEADVGSSREQAADSPPGAGPDGSPTPVDVGKAEMSGDDESKSIPKSPVPAPSAQPEPIAASSPAETATSAEPAQPVHFTVYHPKEIRPKVWYKLLAYVHLPNALETVQEDRLLYLGPQAEDYGRGPGQATVDIARGAEITIVPELPGCRFNPSRSSILWLEDWHRLEFRLQATPDLPGFELDTAVNGRIAFYVGPLLVGEAKIWTYLSDEAEQTSVDQPDTESTAEPYQAVFVSYAHKDAYIVDQLEKAYIVLGMQYLRDVRLLRSGEQWNPALLRKIEEADIFQLCWSYTAQQSIYVEQEWRHALNLARSFFIRPVYWEMPMPVPPPELSDIHFARLELARVDNVR
jgi:hypothetical protein